MRTAWVLVGLLACGGGGSDAPADAPIDSAAPCTHLQNLRLVRGRSFQFGAMGGRFDGMLCIAGRADGCVVTDLEGKFQICAPSGEEFAIQTKKTGYDNALYLHGPGTTGAVNDQYNVGSDAYLLEKLWMPLSASHPSDATHGNLIVIVSKLDSTQAFVGIPNATVAILPVNGLVVRYANDAGEADTTLNATSMAGLALIGNVPLGDYDIQINGATGCASASGGYASPDNSQNARITVASAATTILSLKCL